MQRDEEVLELGEFTGAALGEVHVAHRLRDNFPHGVLFAECAGMVQPEDVASQVGRFLRVLGVGEADVPAGLADRAALLRTALAGRRVLLVLDDVADASIVRTLLPSDPSAAVTASVVLPTPAAPVTTTTGTADPDARRPSLTASTSGRRPVKSPMSDGTSSGASHAGGPVCVKS